MSLNWCTYIVVSITNLLYCLYVRYIASQDHPLVAKQFLMAQENPQNPLSALRTTCIPISAQVHGSSPPRRKATLISLHSLSFIYLPAWLLILEGVSVASVAFSPRNSIYTSLLAWHDITVKIASGYTYV